MPPQFHAFTRAAAATSISQPCLLLSQVKIFGGYTRWSSDVAPPSESLQGRVIVSTIDTAVRMATAGPAPGEGECPTGFQGC
jgi:hypothetical protein